MEEKTDLEARVENLEKTSDQQWFWIVIIGIVMWCGLSNLSK